MEIRPTSEADLPTIQSIYAHEVENGSASFELVAPDLEEMTERFRKITEGGYCHLVAVEHGQVIGYAYTSEYRNRPAYRYSIENSIYVHPKARRKHVASNLLSALIDASSKGQFHQMIAVIGDSENHASIQLHLKQGFREVGVIRRVGYKFDRWLDTVIMQRDLPINR